MPDLVTLLGFKVWRQGRQHAYLILAHFILAHSLTLHVSTFYYTSSCVFFMKSQTGSFSHMSCSFSSVLILTLALTLVLSFHPISMGLFDPETNPSYATMNPFNKESDYHLPRKDLVSACVCVYAHVLCLCGCVCACVRGVCVLSCVCVHEF